MGALTRSLIKAGMTRTNVCTFKEDFLRLDVRDSVPVRRVVERKQTLFYLSLFDDEVDSRLEEFLAFTPRTNWSELVLAVAALRLEPTDAVVIACSHAEILIARGGACNFPLYWTATADSILVSTVLPVDRDRRLSVAGLMASFAASATGKGEPNLALCAPLSGWFRCRRGAVSKLSSGVGCVSERLVDLVNADGTQPDRDHLTEAIRSALDKFGRRQQGHPRAVAELSGGFDSTLAAIATRTHGVELLGVSVHFPYYEFRFEEDIQRAVAKSLAISRVRLDGTTLFSYAPPDWWPKLDEPATSVIGLKRDLAVARLASSEGIDRVFVGHGGDQLFSDDMLEPLPPPIPLARAAFSKAGWQEVEHVRELMQSIPKFLKRSVLTHLHDARLDVAMKEAFGTITRSPFIDLEMASCGISWARLSAHLSIREGKGILADAFAAELPSVVTGRMSKVTWDGVCARAYAAHGDSIVTEIERVAAPLEHIGLNVGWLVGRVDQLASWEKTAFGKDDKEVFAAYAVATWLRSWGVERVSDCSWSD